MPTKKERKKERKWREHDEENRQKRDRRRPGAGGGETKDRKRTQCTKNILERKKTKQANGVEGCKNVIPTQREKGGSGKEHRDLKHMAQRGRA